MNYNILVCDDEKDILGAIEIYLKADGHNVFTATDGMSALKIVEKNEIHLAIVDIMMPVMDGISLIMKMREITNIPIIILSAKSEVTDKIVGLNVGADDYITKPFNAVELTARVNSLIRRYFSLGASNIQTGDLKIGRVSIFDKSKEVRVEDEVVSLTPYEYKILYLLMKNPGRVFSSNEIYESVWEEEAINVRKIISVHVSHLRDKVEINPRKPDLIKSVYGMGYKIEDK
ncbi:MULTISPECIES: response regulator transcription factor [Peptoniphilus]|uniref:response regulator transcription factor n=1 Tax=Peptoniphilus TaxID=162289 RepID=UPI0008DA74D2|nr:MULTISPECIES: response regulator transcription factor [Peptoniphilus]MBS6611349.1 response regulator transcription factor [Peptoniphilus harei]MDU1955216.1 response regulator transcription factor [Peptoniphilus lacydonensis]MDU2116071.1 response regulator transcription factor [Peptoniphilus lacydonensis]MDU5275443.1 response regulator transcription factor [Peptoniphilus lacydonensis]MDU5378131.1 response regulator transcription factor [Peptoniphilus lacydonensis]